MKSHVLLILAICGFMSFSCSQKKKTKKKEVQVQARLIAPILTNYNSGILFGRNAQGQTFSHWISDNTFFMSFPNSIMDFGVIGWNGPTPFTGTTFCDYKTGISLEGGDLALDFFLTTGKCKSSIFGQPRSKDGSGAILPAKINTCANFDNQIREEREHGGIVNPMDMTNLPYCEDEIFGKEKSFRFAYYPFELTFDPNATRKPPIFSSCMVRSDLNSPIAPTSDVIPHLSFPLLDPGFITQPIEIHAFDSSDCSGGASIINFDLGHAHTAVADQGLINVDVDKGMIGYTVSSELCTGSYLTAATMFANKNFISQAEGDTYIICTLDQFRKLITNSAPPSGIQGHNNNDKFILSANIDMSSVTSYTPIGDSSNPFVGHFVGSGFTISNFTYAHSAQEVGLFGRVGDEAEIADLTINNFHFTVDGFTGDNPAGILVGHASGDGIEISDIEINNSSISLTSTYNSGATAYMGGAIGKTTVIGGKRITIEDVNVFATDVDYNNAASYTDLFVGGVIGKSDSTGGGDVEIRSVSFEQGNVISYKNVGGIAGMIQGYSKIEHAHVHADSVTGNKIIGHEFVGGIAGKMFDNSTIYASVANVDLKLILDATTQQVGGLVGHIDAGQVIDSSVVVSMDLDSGTTGGSNGTDYGGAVGRCQGGGPGPCLIKNNHVDFSIANIAGSNIGGAVGNLMNGKVSHNYIDGSIPFENFSDNGRGGIAGLSTGGQIMSYNYLDISVAGYSATGGFLGWGEGIIEYNYLSPRATIWRADGGFDYGAIAGEFGNADYNMARAWGNVLEASFIAQADTDCTSNCVSFVGDPLGTDPDTGEKTYSHNIFNGSVFWEDLGGAESARNLGSAFIGLSGVGYDNNVDLPNDNPYSYNSFHTTLTGLVYDHFDSDTNNVTDRFLIYVQDLESMGGMDGNRLNVFGNAVDPFPLSDCHDWDDIANSDFLHSKSYELTNDIFFNAAGCPGFVPLGGPVVANVEPIPFTGSIRANEKWLRNINYNINVSTSVNPVYDLGIIRKLGDADVHFPGFIGNWEDPLVITNSHVHVQSATGDVVGGIAVGVGHVEDGNVFLRVENSSLTDDSGTGSNATYLGVGGVVGWMEQGFMANSGFYYKSSATSTQVANTFVNSNNTDPDVSVGGLVGLIGNQSFSGKSIYTHIESSVVRSDVTSATGEIGGVIGQVFDGGAGTETIANVRNLIYNNYRSATVKYIDNASGTNEGSILGKVNYGATGSQLNFNGGSMAKIPVGKIDNEMSIGNAASTIQIAIHSYSDVVDYRALVLFMKGAGTDNRSQDQGGSKLASLFYTDNNSTIIEDELDSNESFYDVEFNLHGEPTIYWEVNGLHMD